MRYSDAGVSIDLADGVKSRIGRIVRSTFTPRVLTAPGLFGAAFAGVGRGEVLVASCDGVGTKLTVAGMVGRHDTVGADLVNHSVNDILTLGARPLFFLDYIAASRLDPAVMTAVVGGLARACRSVGCALIGGETAIMPGWFSGLDYDLVGFIVGSVAKRRLIRPDRLVPGDVAIGLPSSGLHTNGYSLARKVLFERAGYGVEERLPGLRLPLGRELLRPHRCYLPLVHQHLHRVKALAHITGGGFYDNIARLLPAECSCIIRRSSWRPGAIFRLIQQAGDVPDFEMYRTFNMGIGMVLFAAPGQVDAITNSIPGARVVGRLVRGTFGVSVV
ncbi:MAG TPA: phosphoribosylformylglycinamidine cyclo-ligase [candidate division WOR-3 bacterium]|uniref:Phosphoribosylformylglycinamidine cyclo-ligase n=1 Tax=candidate division WOR-3 bacterium TaxID=2052148 RepID=A0A7V0XE28_UNCW3|nr:phosphoribosylformylglycinamidine cyclo-ligase [candidate division WOR-3 bacterium]